MEWREKLSCCFAIFVFSFPSFSSVFFFSFADHLPEKDEKAESHFFLNDFPARNRTVS